MKSTLLVAVAVSALVANAQELKCREQENEMGEPNPCTVDVGDCCPGLECLPSKYSPKIHTCQSTSSTDAAVSHVLVNSASQFAETLRDAMDTASAKIAAANKELEGMAAEASKEMKLEEDKVAAKAQKVQDAYKDAVEKGKKLSQQAKEDATLAAERMTELAERVKEEARLVIEKAKEDAKKLKSDAGDSSTTDADVTALNSASKKSDKKKSEKHESKDKATDADDSSNPASGFSSYIPGSGSSGGGMGGFDWQKFMPGAKNSVSMAQSSPAGAGGFDWSKYSPSKGDASTEKGSKKADAAPGGFDWKKYNPSATAGTKNMAAAAAAPGQPGMGTQMNEGKSGGPCGKTNFKRFKDCDPGLECQAGPAMSMGWSPGTCVEKKTTKTESKATNSAVDTTLGGTPRLPGEEGGPCGTTSFMHFGDCESGLECQAPSDANSFMPSTCVKAGSTTSAEASKKTVANASSLPFGGMDGGFDISKWDGMPGMKTTMAMFATPAEQTLSDAQVLSMADDASSDASMLAEKAKEAADAISASLHAAADKLKASAAKMKAKADAIRAKQGKDVKGSSAAESTVQSAAMSGTNQQTSNSSMGWYLAFVGSGLVLGTVVVMKKKTNKYNQYDVIDTQGAAWQP